jgi:hypothetical protein
MRKVLLVVVMTMFIQIFPLHAEINSDKFQQAVIVVITMSEKKSVSHSVLMVMETRCL